MSEDLGENDGRTFECWNCRAEVSSGLFERMMILHGRRASRGGPYYSFRCPSCRELWVGYRSDGELVVKPPDGEFVLDTVLGWFAPSIRKRAMRIRDWFARKNDDETGQPGYRRPAEDLPSRDRTPRGDDRSAQDRAMLGVDRGAGLAQIKDAFNRLAKELHPDVVDEAEAETRFREVREAYERLRESFLEEQ